MFTGIVEAVGKLRDLESVGGRVDLCLEVGSLTEGVEIGDSVALDGCCLTVTRAEPGVLWFQAIPETLAKTSLGQRRPGDRINVERALRADARLDGHIVQGHVDGTGEVVALLREGEDVRMTVSCSSEFGALLVPKGSVAIDGVSLTVVDPEPTAFSVALIPHTLSVTNLGDRKRGDLVNLEGDVLGKYVLQYLERRGLA